MVGKSNLARQFLLILLTLNPNLGLFINKIFVEIRKHDTENQTLLAKHNCTSLAIGCKHEGSDQINDARMHKRLLNK